MLIHRNLEMFICSSSAPLMLTKPYLLFPKINYQQSSLHVADCRHGCTAWTRGGWAHNPGGLQSSVLDWRRRDCQSKLSMVCLWGSPASSCRVWYSSWVLSLSVSLIREVCWMLSWNQQSAFWRRCCYFQGVDLWAQNANWWGSRLAGMWRRVYFSKHFIRMGVSATGR